MISLQFVVLEFRFVVHHIIASCCNSHNCIDRHRNFGKIFKSSTKCHQILQADSVSIIQSCDKSLQQCFRFLILLTAIITLCQFLNKHAPLKSKNIHTKPCNPWFTKPLKNVICQTSSLMYLVSYSLF